MPQTISTVFIIFQIFFIFYFSLSLYDPLVIFNYYICFPYTCKANLKSVKRQTLTQTQNPFQTQKGSRNGRFFTSAVF